MTKRTSEYNKLVRDRIPDIISASGERPHTRVLGGAAYSEALLQKLVEEAQELLENPGYEERADVAEVLRAIDRVFKLDADEIEKVRQDKVASRGGFQDGIFLESVDED